MDFISTAEACRSPKRSGMFERDAVVSHSTLNGARKRAIHFTAFDTDNDRRVVPGDNYATRQGMGYSPVQGGGMAIAQRDISGMGRRGCRDGLGSAGLVVASRRVIDAEGEGGGVGGDLCDGYGVCFSAHRADGGGSRIRCNGGEGGAAAEFQGFSVWFTQLQGEAQGSYRGCRCFQDSRRFRQGKDSRRSALSSLRRR